jgi:ABC-2 type transport system permease protein
MWRTVLRLEWRIVRRDRAALAVLALFAGFLVLAALAGGGHADTLAEGLERTEAAERSRLDGHQAEIKERMAAKADRTAKDPRDAVWMGKQGASRVAILPPSPLAPIAVGQRQLHPQAVRVSTEMNLAAERETETAMSGPTRLMTGAFDPAFLFVVLFPLVIIALSYELLSGERERGTLAMLLSQPVSQHALVLGKAAARALLLCAVTFLFALLGLVLAGADLSGDGAVVHIALYAAVLVAWALFWFAAAVAVNAWGQSSASNALSLVGLWLLLVVVVPGLMHVVVDAIYPPPSKVELLHEAREAGQEVERKLAGLEGRHDVDTTTKGYAKRVVEVQQELARRSEPVLQELRAQVAKRQSMVDTLRFVSPAIVTQLALEDVAGAGAVRHQRFEAQVDTYHEQYRAYFFAHIQGESPSPPRISRASPLGNSPRRTQAISSLVSSAASLGFCSSRQC